MKNFHFLHIYIHLYVRYLLCIYSFFFFSYFCFYNICTWRSGAVLGCARSQADSHGFNLAREPVLSSSFNLPNMTPSLGLLLCWLVPRRASEINASAITTSPGPGRILTSGSAALAWCRPAWDALATLDDLGARAHGPIITDFFCLFCLLCLIDY